MKIIYFACNSEDETGQYLDPYDYFRQAKSQLLKELGRFNLKDYFETFNYPLFSDRILNDYVLLNKAIYDEETDTFTIETFSIDEIKKFMMLL